ncbi:carboxypeptidase M isoform X2 [Halyomorpha halys]|uniref:carboxypeptidase M isoform X2 n=1 Tax=Halyomorpha halys TaxID=286706 RepID=UPI0006D51D23|nr:carboxypeptidase M-like isoform X2 [Halyomorpha halys]
MRYSYKLWMAAWLLVSGLVDSVLADSRRYMSNEELRTYLNTTAHLEPTLASVYSIGFTELNWDIPVVVLSATESTEQVPNVKFIAGVHGDEAIGTEVLISFIEYLIDAYRREERFVTWLLNNTRIHILPRLNLEGFHLAIEGVCNLGPGRENSAGYDLNRVFSPSEDYVAEAAAVINWLKFDTFVLSATVNAGEVGVVYPPDNAEDNGGKNITTDDDVFKHLASVYARNHRIMSTANGCKDKIFNNGIINGAAWYPIKGSMADYNYKSGTMELTLEVSCCKYPPSDQIRSIWEENKLALLKLAAESCRGVRGRVTALGNPIAGATVSILGRSMTVKTNEQGYYFRILLPGRYFIKVEAEGMKTLISEFFVPQSDTAFLKWEVVNIHLELNISQYPASYDNVFDALTTSDGEGGLDPYTTPIYNDSYLSSNYDNTSDTQTIIYDEGGLDPYTTPTYNDSYLSSNYDNTTAKTISNDEGGLDPYTTPTYNDTYLSSQDDSQIRVGNVKGAANKQYQNNFYYILIIMLCKYLIVCILTGLFQTNCILF